jgi:hypothetical protein
MKARTRANGVQGLKGNKDVSNFIVTNIAGRGSTHRCHGGVPRGQHWCRRMFRMAFFRSRALVVTVACLAALALFVSMAVMFI